MEVGWLKDTVGLLIDSFDIYVIRREDASDGIIFVCIYTYNFQIYQICLNKSECNIVVVQEAIATGDPEIVQLCLQFRDSQRFSQRSQGVPGLLQRLNEVYFSRV